MKLKVFSILMTLALVLTLGLVTAVPVGAYDYDEYTNAITKTADRLVALQGTDGGWDWIVTDLTTHSETIPSSFNLFGVTALGLIDAYQVTADEAYYVAAGKTADHLKGLSRASDDDVRIMTFDYRFLVEFSALSADPLYEAHALSEWNWVKTNVADYYADGNQEAIYTFWLEWTPPPAYAAWQAADCGLAALAMGDTSYAGNMAAVLVGHLDEILEDDICRFIGWGHALEFLNAVDSVTYATEIDNLITNLKGSQNADGSWGTGQNAEGYAQDAAYAIMGLAAAGGADAIAAAEEGADWLVTNQGYDLIEGGWNNSTDDEEYSETDSEALQAIKAVLDISGAVSMSAAYIPSIGISVTPTSIDFGDVVPDVAKGPETVTVENTGDVAVDLTASITGESHPPVYANGLTIDGNLVSVWNATIAEPDGIVVTALVLTVPLETAPGTYTATLIFWAEAS